jgi:hypothetical protein
LAHARVDDAELEEKARAAIAALIARRMLALDAITWKVFSWRAVSHARRTSGSRRAAED